MRVQTGHHSPSSRVNNEIFFANKYGLFNFALECAIRKVQENRKRLELNVKHQLFELAALAQMVACLHLVQQVRGSILGRLVNFHLKIFNLGARRGGDVHFLIARLYITVLD